MPYVLGRANANPLTFQIVRQTTHPGAEDFSVEINKRTEAAADSDRLRRRPQHPEIQKYVSTTSSTERKLGRVERAA